MMFSKDELSWTRHTCVISSCARIPAFNWASTVAFSRINLCLNESILLRSYPESAFGPVYDFTSGLLNSSASRWAAASFANGSAIHAQYRDCRLLYTVADYTRNWCEQIAYVFLLAFSLHRLAQEKVRLSLSRFHSRGGPQNGCSKFRIERSCDQSWQIVLLLYLFLGSFRSSLLRHFLVTPSFHRLRRTFDHSSTSIHQTTTVQSSLVFIYRTSSSCTRKTLPR